MKAEVDYQRLLAVKKAAQKRLLKIPGVHAVGVGAKQVAGQRTPVVSIAVFVTKKKPPGELAPEHAIPAEIDGFKTDVIEQPPPRLLAGPALPDRRTLRPIRGGIRLQPGGPLGGGGTIGCLARTIEPQPRIVGITCWHVVADPPFDPSAISVSHADDSYTFSGSNTPGSLIVFEAATSADSHERSAYYVTAPGDDLAAIAAGVAQAVIDTKLPGLTASAAGSVVTVTMPPDLRRGDIFVYGPRKTDVKSKLHATVSSPSGQIHDLTITGQPGDGQGLYVTVHEGGAAITFGVFVAVTKNLAIRGVVTKVADAIRATITDLAIAGISVSTTTGKVTITGAEAVTCEVTSDTRVGQPDNRFGCSTSWCTNNRIGKVLAARADVDTALIELDPGLKYLAEIEELGVVKDFYAVQDAEAHEHHEYPVKKRGMATGLTEGTILHLHVDGFIPLDANTPFGRMYTEGMHLVAGLSTFADSGDSGSAVVSDSPPNDGKVVGIIFGAGSTLIGSTFAMATPIQLIEKALKVAPETATAAQAGLLRTVPTFVGSPMSALDEEAALGPVSLAGRPSPELRDRLMVVGQEVSASPVGEAIAAAVQRHIPETQDLINDHRRVGAVWRRNGGTQIVQGFLDMVQAPPERAVTLPPVINGRALGECFRRIYKVLLRYGSAAFGEDLRRLGPIVLAGATLTYPQMLETLRAAGDAPMAAAAGGE